MKTTKIRLTAAQHATLKQHLLPGDGKEAVAVLLGGRRAGVSAHCLVVHEVVCIPHALCMRSADRVRWSTSPLAAKLERAARKNFAVVKVHSHPGGYSEFSALDDASDRSLFASIFGWYDTEDPHASVIMFSDGSMIGRSVHWPGPSFRPLESIQVVGDDLVFHIERRHDRTPGFAQRHGQLFGEGTIARLRSLSAAVVGCSGTGSVVCEMLARLGIGRLVLVDHDQVEIKNLNRILNATWEDAIFRRPKVEVLGRAIGRMGLGTDVQMVPHDLESGEAVRAVADCDVVFGCLDAVVGRNLLNRIGTFYLLPYFDLGVKLVADGEGGIDEACGAVHYVRPDGETLEERGVYTADQLKAEGLLRSDPVAYAEQRAAGYIVGVPEDRPAVISVNAHIASIAVNEFLARLHPYRLDGNEDFASVRVSFIQGESYHGRESAGVGPSRYLGRGDLDPLLDMPVLSRL